MLIFTLLLLCITEKSYAFEPITLGQYMHLVMRDNDLLRSGVKNVEAAYYAVLASVSYQRPALSVSTTVSYLTGNEQTLNSRRDSNITDYNINVGVSHQIDLSGKYTLDEHQQVLCYEIQRADFDNLMNEILAAAEENYWSAILARENILLQKDVLRRREEDLRVASEKHRLQAVPKLDVIRAEAMVVAARGSIIEAEAEYRNLLAVMSKAAGGYDVMPAEEKLGVPLLDVTADLPLALVRRPDVRAAQAASERAQIIKKLTAKA